MSSPLFRGGFGNFLTPPCANCGKVMIGGIQQVFKIKGEKVRVCSVQCEDELRAKHNEPRKPLKFKQGKPSRRIEM